MKNNFRDVYEKKMKNPNSVTDYVTKTSKVLFVFNDCCKNSNSTVNPINRNMFHLYQKYLKTRIRFFKPSKRILILKQLTHENIFLVDLLHYIRHYLVIHL